MFEIAKNPSSRTFGLKGIKDLKTLRKKDFQEIIFFCNFARKTFKILPLKIVGGRNICKNSVKLRNSFLSAKVTVVKV